MRVRIWLMGVLPVLAVLGTLAGLGYVKYRGIRQAMAAASMMTEPVETVRMVAVETVPFQRFLTAVGTVSALQHLVLSTETAGKVVEVRIVSGPRVFHAAVRHAMLAYQCSGGDAEIVATQDFTFKLN